MTKWDTIRAIVALIFPGAKNLRELASVLAEFVDKGRQM